MLTRFILWMEYPNSAYPPASCYAIRMHPALTCILLRLRLPLPPSTSFKWSHWPFSQPHVVAVLSVLQNHADNVRSTFLPACACAPNNNNNNKEKTIKTKLMKKELFFFLLLFAFVCVVFESNSLFFALAHKNTCSSKKNSSIECAAPTTRVGVWDGFPQTTMRRDTHPRHGHFFDVVWCFCTWSMQYAHTKKKERKKEKAKKADLPPAPEKKKETTRSSQSPSKKRCHIKKREGEGQTTHDVATAAKRKK